MFAAISWIGSAIAFVVKKFFPFIIKKFGAYAVKGAIQKAVSAIVILITLSFYAAVLVFISETYTQFKAVLAILNDPSSTVGGGDAGTYFNCFLNLMQSSGISNGFNSAFSFGISVFIFFFLRASYSMALKAAKTVSDEVSKNLKLI